jgi:hypothetical protein
MNAKTVAEAELLKRATESLSPEVVQLLEKGFGDMRDQHLKQRQIGQPIELEPLRLTSTVLKFKVVEHTSD